MTTINHQVKGASVDLQTLQRLRFLAHGFNHSKQKARARISGGHRSKQHSRGMEFEEVRIYQAGDDVRTIDWRVTARTQTPHTKCFQEEKEKPVITLVDQRSSMFFGSKLCFKSAYACQLSAIINWATLARGDRSGGMVIGTQSIGNSRSNRTKSSLNRWLQQLTDYNQQLFDAHKNQSRENTFKPSLKDALSQLDNSSHNGAEIFIISDFYGLDHHCEHLLFKLAKHHALYLYWIVDPIEIQLPLVDQATFSDGEKQQQISITPNVQESHHLNFLTKKERLTQLSRQLKCEFITINIDTPLLNIYQTSE